MTVEFPNVGVHTYGFERENWRTFYFLNTDLGVLLSGGGGGIGTHKYACLRVVK